MLFAVSLHEAPTCSQSVIMYSHHSVIALIGLEGNQACLFSEINSPEKSEFWVPLKLKGWLVLVELFCHTFQPCSTWLMEICARFLGINWNSVFVSYCLRVLAVSSFLLNGKHSKYWSPALSFYNQLVCLNTCFSYCSPVNSTSFVSEIYHSI